MGIPEEIEMMLVAVSSIVKIQAASRRKDDSKLSHKYHALTCGNDSSHLPLYPWYDEFNECIFLKCVDCGYECGLPATVAMAGVLLDDADCWE